MGKLHDKTASQEKGLEAKEKWPKRSNARDWQEKERGTRKTWRKIGRREKQETTKAGEGERDEGYWKGQGKGTRGGPTKEKEKQPLWTLAPAVSRSWWIADVRSAGGAPEAGAISHVGAISAPSQDKLPRTRADRRRRWRGPVKPISEDSKADGVMEEDYSPLTSRGGLQDEMGGQGSTMG